MKNSDNIYIPSLDEVEKIFSQYKINTPFFITNEDVIKHRINLFKKSFKDKISLYYAMKANYNPKIIAYLKDSGVNGIDAVSPFEVQLAKKIGFSSDQIIFTGNNSSKSELAEISKLNIILNIGSLSELKNFCEMFPNQKISLRINPNIGDGESKGVITGGEYSKFGLQSFEIDSAIEIINKNHVKLIGIHCHIGSGFYNVNNFQKSIETVTKECRKFNDLEFIDFGGGFGIRYKTDQKSIDLGLFYKSIEKIIDELKSKNIKIIFEPGKYLVGESTALITKVTTIKKVKKTILIGTDTGFNHLIRPAFYNSSHHIINLSKKSEKSLTISNEEDIKVFGNICESSDYFGNLDCDHVQESDTIAILSCGAYCSSMSMLYNLRPYASEFLINNENIKLIKKSLNFNQLIDSCGFV